MKFWAHVHNECKLLAEEEFEPELDEPEYYCFFLLSFKTFSKVLSLEAPKVN
jgi:hypothetical protein